MIKTFVQCDYCETEYVLNSHHDFITAINLSTNKDKFYCDRTTQGKHHICNKCLKMLYDLLKTFKCCNPILNE